MIKTTIPLFSILALASTAIAGQQMTSKETKEPVPTECFAARELQLDIFGQYSDGNGPVHAGTFKDHAFGGGIGVNYFFTRNFGMGVDAAWLSGKEAPYTSRNSERVITHNFSASLIYRFPIDSICLAPYVFAGAGFVVDGAQWATAHAGAGIEYWVIPQKLGLFADTRWTYLGDRYGHDDLNNVSARVGVRVVF